MPFGQVILGHPGSGKTHYCLAMKEVLTALQRKPLLINLDPANEPTETDITFDIDIRHLIKLEEVQEELELGPNGSLMFCLQYVAKNIDWLFKQLKNHSESYFIIDLPGQVELYTCHDALSFILNSLNKSGISLCCVHLVDASIACTASNFVSLCLLSLDCFFGIALPTVQLISKADLLGRGCVFPGRLEDFLIPSEPDTINHYLNKETGNGRQELNKVVAELISTTSFLSFGLCSIEEKRTLFDVLCRVDEALGFIPVGQQKGITWTIEDRAQLIDEFCERHNEILDKIE